MTRRIILALLVIAACIASDQATKLLAKRYLIPGETISFAADTVRLQYAENSGAFLSLGSSLSEPWRHLVFTFLVGLFLLGLLFYTLFNGALATHHALFLLLVCAGGISNVIDRIAYDGSVVDFLNMGIGPLRTGIFNVADMAITTGAVLLALDALMQPREKPPPS
jgi:signal peptidase II